MSDIDDQPETAEAEDLVRRACDQCRFRKIRCDRKIPCSNCTTIQQRCAFTGAGRRAKEPRQRVLISAQYERKVDHIERNLVQINTTLKGVVESLHRIEERIKQGSSSNDVIESAGLSGRKTAPEIAGHQYVSTSRNPGYRRHQARSGINDASYEGNSSLAAHAAFAGQFFKHAVEDRSPQEPGPRLRAALSSLQNVLHLQKPKGDIHFTHAKVLGDNGLRDLAMPPLNEVLVILRELKEAIPLSFSIICALTSIQYFTEQCRMVYFATEDFTQATFIIVNAGLFYIMQEKIALATHAGDIEKAANFLAYRNMCRDNLETALSTLDLLVPARKENIEALVMGSSYAIEISKPSIAWRFNAVACQLCLALGYHRASPHPEDTEDAKNRRSILFWMAYIFDKALALRLGHPSIIQDYDITLSYQLGPLGEFDGHRETIQSWIAHARVQGMIYQDLYSPAALSRPAEHRLKAAQDCARSLLFEADKLSRARRSIHEGQDGGLNISNTEILAMLVRSDEVAILSTLTLVYRTIPPESVLSPDRPSGSPSTFCDDCILVARKAMQMHLECTAFVEASPMLAAAYIHWTVLFSPFIPFIVLCCHVIESGDTGDLDCIANFAISLEPWRNLSDHVDRLFRLCQVLYEVTLVYTQTIDDNAERACPDHTPLAVQDSLSNEFDTYLYQLGLLPAERLTLMPGANGNNESASLPCPNLDDWFSGYMNVIGLSEFTPPSQLGRE